MKNVTKEAYEASELIHEDPYNNGLQAAIFLVVNWEDKTVDVETHIGNGVSEAIWNRRATRMRLPDNINTDTIHDDVEGIMPRIREIYEGYEPYYDGNNTRGVFSEDAASKLLGLEHDIGMAPEQIFHTHEFGGLCEIEYWYEAAEEITSTTTDEEIRELAEYHYSDAYNQGIIINGGVPAIVDHLARIRAEKMDDDEMEDDE